MPLDVYHARRDFGRTPEPKGDEKTSAGEGLRYVIQKHGARRLHYDFRLEWHGVLKSWAVPRGPSLVVGERRLAVPTEDHPLSYADFEGVIPAGEYGGGPVIVWDRGRWLPDGDPAAALEAGELTFRLDGEKLRGGWRLVRTGADGDWLLMKRRDAFADEGRSVVDAAPASVISGRTLEEVESGRPPATAEVTPQLATAVEAPPRGDDWLHEIKLDGYRLLAHKRGEAVRLVTRKGLDWTARFPSVRAAVERLAVSDAVLDGEVVVFDRRGRSDFGALQAALSAGRGAFVFVAFDLLRLGGRDVRPSPLGERKAALKRLLEASGDGIGDAIRYADHVIGGGPAMLREACAMGLEGIVSKRIDAPYRGGRGRRWLKIKCAHRQELVVLGFTEPRGGRSDLGALLLGVHRDGALRYAGKCGAGLDAGQRADLRARLEPLRRETAPVPGAPEEAGRRWVEPALVAEVVFNGWTRAGRVRQAVFVGLRRDKAPAEVVVEKASVKVSTKGSKTSAKASAKASTTVAGVKISHPERALFSEAGLTKLDLARYFERVADAMLPRLAERPLSLVRCPGGIAEPCFFQKHPLPGLPDAVPRVDVGDGEPHLMVRDARSLVTLAQFGVIELHPWGARADRLDRPDVLVFDLDPGDDVPWRRVVATALTLRDHLEGLGLAAFARATGGKGLHVVVPIERRTPWDAAKGFTRAVAGAFERADPAHYTARADKSLRHGRIFIDYLRNGRGATAVADWSPRARPGAPVAHPLAWSALDGDADGPPRLTVRGVLDGAAPVDAWGDAFEAGRRRLTRAMLDRG